MIVTRIVKYSRTSPQRLPWGQKKVAVVERLPVWGGSGCNMTIFREYNMFIVLRSCLLSSIRVIIQTLNNIIIEIKIRKKLELCFESKCQPINKCQQYK